MVTTPILNIKAMDELLLPQNLQTWIKLLNPDVNKNRGLISSDSKTLQELLQLAIDLDVIGVKTPKHYGGLDLDLVQQHYYYKTLAQASGTLAFFLSQFSLTALSILAAGNNITLKDQWLNKDTRGNNSCGVSFAHLRNITAPPVVAKEEKTHYVVNGDLRYITGYRIFNMLVLGFVCKDEEIFALTPFCESKSFIVKSRLELITANSTNTVSCKLINHCIDKNMIISKHPLGTLQKTGNVRGRHIVAFQIGLGQAALDLISNSRYLETDKAREAYNYLRDKLAAYDAEMLLLPENVSVIPTRIKVMDILSKIFLFGDQIFKGAATIADHPFQLIKQEAQIFAATASIEETLLETCNLLLNHANE
ncbi:MAG: hypothetical protein K0R14_171 [Burkholderiales bacterium]|jgi:alkylation response protein AidB-like acyl-CoA dehydrogenase|nr:hypothetical protein [Burkholderiales bacterium]